MTCIVKNAENFTGRLRFQQVLPPKNNSHYINQKSENICHSAVSITICGRGTNNRFSYEKLYIMMFKALSLDDSGEWKCFEDFTHVTSNSYTLDVAESECLCLFIDTSSVYMGFCFPFSLSSFLSPFLPFFSFF